MTAPRLFVPAARPGIPGTPLGAPASRRPRAKRDIAPPPSGVPESRNPGIPGIARAPCRAARDAGGTPAHPGAVPDRRRRARALVVALALFAPAPAAAEGGSFTLCYERLKQLAALYAAQGAEVSEPVDDPGARRYALELRIAGAVRRLACGPDGRIERPAEEE